MRNRIFKNLAIYLLIVFIAVSIARWVSPENEVIDINHTTFMEKVEAGEVEKVTLVSDRNVYHVEGIYKDGKEFSLETSVTPTFLRCFGIKGWRLP